MAATLELSEAQRIALNHDTTEVTTDELSGLIDRRGDEWKKTPAGQEIIKLLEAKRKRETQIAQEAAKSRHEQIPQATRPGKAGTYSEGPQKFEVNPSSSFEVISDNQSVEEMGMIVKRNINLLQLRVRTQWIKHFDDMMLGSVLNINEEYEHFGRMLTDIASRTGIPLYGVSITNARDADNIVSLGQLGAAGQIDALVRQHGDGGTDVKNARPLWTSDTKFRTTSDRDAEIKKMLKNMNDAVIAEDGATGMWIGLYLSIKLGGSALGASLKKLLELSTIKGVGGKQVLAIMAEWYEMLDRKMKGADPANKTIWDSVKDRLHVEKFVGVDPVNLSPEQREIRESQLKGVREVVRESLYSSHGNGLTHQEFMKKMETGVSDRSVAGALRAESEIMKKLSPHLPINMDMAVTDRYELEQKFSRMALDMETSTWNKLKRGLWRFFFEKGTLTNLVLHNKAINPSRWTSSGSYAPGVVANAEGLMRNLDMVQIEVHGEKLSVPRANADMIKGVIEAVELQVMAEALDSETRLKAEIRNLETEINRLKLDGIPDTEQGVKDLEDRLREAQRRLPEFTQLDAAAGQARQAHSQADQKIESSRSEVARAETALGQARANQSAYIEYGQAKQVYEGEVRKESEARAKADTTSRALIRSVSTTEAILASRGITFTPFDATGDIADLSERAGGHIRTLQQAVTSHNRSASARTAEIDIANTFGEANSSLTRFEAAEATMKQASAAVAGAKTTLDSKIQAMTDLGLWEATNTTPNTDGKILSDKVKTAETSLQQAQDTLKKAERDVEKAKEAVEKVKGKIKADPLNSTLNKPTTIDGSGKKTYSIKTEAEIRGESRMAHQMKVKLSQLGDRKGRLPDVENARIEALTRVGVSQVDAQSISRKPDGTIDQRAKKLIDDLISQTAESRVTFDSWKSNLPAGWTVEVERGKAIVRDDTGKLKYEFDPKNVKEAAKVIQKAIKR